MKNGLFEPKDFETQPDAETIASLKAEVERLKELAEDALDARDGYEAMLDHGKQENTALKLEASGLREQLAAAETNLTKANDAVEKQALAILRLEEESDRLTREREATQVLEDNRELFEALAKAEEKE